MASAQGPVMKISSVRLVQAMEEKEEKGNVNIILETIMAALPDHKCLEAVVEVVKLQEVVCFE